jgi:CRISPR-associated endonuclease/helicase Cas3
VVDRRAVVDQATEVALTLRAGVDADPELGKALGLGEGALPISTLRGQHVDNREWLEDPASPAIIVGTVDMVGSRLLFEGYGVSRKMRPYHAGLLGADTLVMLDEAHLVPPFEKLLEAIDNGSTVLGPQGSDRRALVPPFKLLALSATSRGTTDRCHGLGKADLAHEEVVKRLGAKKWLTVVRPPENQEKWDLAESLAAKAWELAENGRKPIRCLVFCDKRRIAQKTLEAIETLAKGDKKGGIGKVDIERELFVGGRRVFEREVAATRLRELGFIAGEKAVATKPTFLVATSAAEVGVDLDAEHMVSDLVAWERMVQRLGRVNRRGNGEASVIVIREPEPNEPKNVAQAKQKTPGDRTKKDNEAIAKHDKKVEAARSWLRPLEHLPEIEGRRDTSPGAIRQLKLRASDDRDLAALLLAATTPAPLRPALTRPLVDAWSMTSLKEHTGRPEIDPWLRGWQEDDGPQTSIVWRKFLPVRRGRDAAKDKQVEDFFEAAPTHTSEVLETETWLVMDWLEKRAGQLAGDAASVASGPEADEARELDVPDELQAGETDDAEETQTEGERDEGTGDGEAPAAALRQWDVVAFLLSPAGDLRRTLRLKDLLDGKKEKDRRFKLEKALAGATLVVDARVAGLDRRGLIDDGESDIPRTADDGRPWLASTDPKSPPVVRFRVRAVEGEAISPPRQGQWRERLRFVTEQTQDGIPVRWLVVDKWKHDSSTEDDRSSGRAQLLQTHTEWVEDRVRRLARRLGLPENYAKALVAAAHFHDEGKRTPRWQRAFKAKPEGAYAKTESRPDVAFLDGYRHEFGSLRTAASDPALTSLPLDLQDLVLHLVASHHGFARPIIGTNGCDDAPPSKLEERAREVVLRFARLQKDWGPWGLAWWEAIFRSADQQASRDNDKEDTTGSKEGI